MIKSSAWTLSPKGYCIPKSGEPTAIGVFKKGKEYEFYLSFPWTPEGFQGSQHYHVTEKKCEEFKGDMPEGVEKIQLYSLNHCHMSKFSRGDCFKWNLPKELRAFIDRHPYSSKSRIHFSETNLSVLALIFIASFLLDPVSIFLLYPTMVVNLVVFNYCLVRCNRDKSEGFIKLHRILEVGGISQLDPKRTLSSRSLYLLRGYMGLILFFSVCSFGSSYIHTYARYVVRVLSVFLVTECSRRLSSLYEQGYQFHEEDPAPLTGRGLYQLIKRASNQEKKVIPKCQWYSSIFVDRFKVSDKQACITFNYHQKTGHTSFYVERHQGGGTLTVIKVDFSPDVDKPSWLPERFQHFFINAWLIFSNSKAKGGVGLNQEGFGLDKHELLNSIDKPHYRRRTFVVPKMYADLLINNAGVTRDLKYNIWVSNCAHAALLWLRAVGVLPIDLELLRKKKLLGLMTYFSDQDNYQAAKAEAYQMPSLRV